MAGAVDEQWDRNVTVAVAQRANSNEEFGAEREVVVEVFQRIIFIEYVDIPDEAFGIHFNRIAETMSPTMQSYLLKLVGGEQVQFKFGAPLAKSRFINSITLARHSLVKMLDGSELDGPPPLRRASTVEVTTSPLAHHSSRLTRRASLDDLEQESCQLTPKIDHRIILINSEERRQELVLQRQRIEQDSIIEEGDEYSPQN